MKRQYNSQKQQQKLVLILLGFLILTILPTDAQRPVKTLGLKAKHSYEAKPSTSINLEDLVQSINPLEVTLHSSGSCSLQRPFLSPDSAEPVLPFAGPFMKGSKPFCLNDKYFTLTIDPQTSQIFLAPYTLESSGGSPPKRSYVSTGNTIFQKPQSTDFLISNHKHSNQISIFNTKSEFIFFKFPLNGSPGLLGTYKASRQPIVDFISVQNKFLFSIESQALAIYEMDQLYDKIFQLAATYSSYTAKDQSNKDFSSPQALAVCDNIVFIGEGSSILIVDGTNSLEKLIVLDEISVDNTVLQIEVVGRSLVVLTSKQIIEYIFVNDCLEIKESIRIANSVAGFGSSLTTEKTFAELKGSPNGNYFSVANKLTSEVYIFQTGNQNKYQPVFHTYKQPEKNLESVELFDYFSDYSENGLDLLIKQSGDQMNLVSFEKNPTRLSCSSLIPKTTSASVTASSRFCHNNMFNYTASALENKEQPDSESSKTIFNPNQACLHEYLFELNYKISTKFILCCVGVLIGCATIIFFMTRMYKNKHTPTKHTKFHDERGHKELDTSTNKIDISSITIPGTATERVESKPDFANKKRPHPTGKKTYSKKKNLQIKIPEIK